MLKVRVVVIRVLFVWSRMGYVDGMCKQECGLSKRLKIAVGTTSYYWKYFVV